MDSVDDVLRNAHLRVEKARLVDPHSVSIRVDGVADEQTRTAVEQLVRDTLSRSWNRPFAEATADTPEGAPGRLHVALAGLPVGERRRRGLERAVRAAIQGVAAEQSSVCFGNPRGDLLEFGASQIVWWDSAGNWIAPPDGEEFWKIGIQLDVARFNAAELQLRNGATWSPPVPRSQVLVGLANDTDWAKEIEAFNLCSGRIGSVYQSGRNAVPHRMLLSAPNRREGADTIVFHKPGFAGFWHPVGHFPPVWFWRAFGGTVADFVWRID